MCISNYISIFYFSDDKGPYILTITQNIITPENTSVQFNCIYENVAYVEWYFGENTEILENNTKYLFFCSIICIVVIFIKSKNTCSLKHTHTVYHL